VADGFTFMDVCRKRYGVVLIIPPFGEAAAGAITTRTIFFRSSHMEFKEEITLNEARPVVFADFGFGVLDAMVDNVAYVVEKA
jgi:hypothetical protein